MDSNLLYTPLSQPRAEIRILEIVSDSQDRALECTLHTVSLDDKPKFTALSYVWGDAKATEDILLNGHLVPITTNLATALRYARHHWQTEILDHPPSSSSGFRVWADALCINQDDLDERRAQVQLMRRIYPGAELVISWLGCDIDGIDVALDILDTIQRETKDQGPNSEDFDMGWLYRYPEWFRNEMMWVAMRDFSRLQYWKRMWIFQELVLGHNVYVAHGTKGFPLGPLVDASDWLRRLRGAYNGGTLPPLPKEMTSLTTMQGWGELERMILIRERVQSYGPFNPSDLKEVVSILMTEFAATDPRDHVYGLLGLLNTDIVPDYSKSVSEVYTSFFDLFIRSTRSLAFVHMSGIGVYGDDQDRDVPSWAPNFMQRGKTDQLDMAASRDAWPEAAWGQADKGLFKSMQRFIDLPAMKGKSIHAGALKCGQVVEVQPPFSEQSLQDGSLYAFVRDLVQSNEYNPESHHPVSQVFWALRPSNVASPPRVPLQQAVSFLYFLLYFPRQDDIAAAQQMLARAAQLQIINNDFEETEQEHLHREFARATVNALNFIDDEENIGFAAEIFGQMLQGQIPSMSTQQHMFDSQALFRLARLDISNRVGLVPQYTHVGDMLAILKGCKVPIVLRARGDQFSVVGSGCLYGAMYGEFGHTQYTGDEWFFTEVELI